MFLREILFNSKYAETALQSKEFFSEDEIYALIKQADNANMLKYCFI